MKHHFLEMLLFSGYLRSFSRKLHFIPLKKKLNPRYRNFFAAVCIRICLNHTFPHFPTKTQLFTAFTDSSESQGKFGPTFVTRGKNQRHWDFFRVATSMKL